MTDKIMCNACEKVAAIWHVSLSDNQETELSVCEACHKGLVRIGSLSFWESIEAYLESKALCTLQDKLIEANQLDQAFDWDNAMRPFLQYDSSYLHSIALAEFLNGGGSLDDARRIGNESACGVNALIDNGYLVNMSGSWVQVPKKGQGYKECKV